MKSSDFKSFHILSYAAVVLVICASIVSAQSGSSTNVEATGSAAIFAGKTLDYWLAEAAGKRHAEPVDLVARALSKAVLNDESSIKVRAADALSALGPAAKPAVPALIAQLGHEQPWVRVSVMAALACVGKEGVPALIDVFQNQTGGPRIRSAFVLGAIGADAKAAVPALAEGMKVETPANQVRLAGILNQIDPDNYPGNVSTRPGPRIELDAAEMTFSAVAGDWPQFHGPNRDSICREQGLLSEWPEEGPKLLWKIEGLGRGFSGISIAAGRIFTMGDRPVDGGQEAQFVIAYNLDNRRELWATRVGPPFQTGPRCTPTVDGDLLYVIGTEGDLLCLQAASGETKWQKDLVDDFGGKIMTGWKFCESPLVDGGRLICTPGADDAVMVAMNKITGKVIWQTSVPDLGDKGADGAGYSSPVVAEIDGVRQYIQLVGRGVISVEAETGRFLWGYNGVANNIANIPTPIVAGNYVFCTTAYNTGSALLEIERHGDAFKAQEMYFINPRDFANHHGGVVRVGEHVYGGHGSNKGDPACIELATGKIVWKERSPSRGSAGVLYADGHLIFRYDRGEVLLVEADPTEFRIKGRFSPISGEGPAWPHPVIHKGKLYLRHGDVLGCYDVRAYK